MKNTIISATIIFAVSGCVGVPIQTHSVYNGSDKMCQKDLSHAFSTILQKQEKDLDNEIVMGLSYAGTAKILELRENGMMLNMPIPNTDHLYRFMLQNRGETCNLRLAARKKGNTTYTNTMTFIETVPIPACHCM